MKYAVLFWCLICLSTAPISAQIQVAPDRYRIEFIDKNFNSYTLCQPELFLSQRALQRRERQGVKITHDDLPVSKFYIDSIKKMGFQVLNTSRWLNSATLKATPEEIEKLQEVDFVKKTTAIQTQKTEIQNEKLDDKLDEFKLVYDDAPEHYGRAAAQIGMLNGHALHRRGYSGQGMLIAVIDGGFYNVNQLSGFENLRTSGRLREIKNFTPDVENPSGDNSHGTNVLSILAAYLPGQLIGAAPDAEYVLLRSEEIEHEYIVEEDNWISAVEYADSLGVDVISCSLGYTIFNNISQNHCKTTLDGRTVRTSRAATMAAARGIILCISAGNDGDNNWRLMSVPADADSIIAVGAVYPDGQRASFSSVGPTADNRIKPDLMAVGARTAYQNSSGFIVFGNGTSYSTPLIAGLIACLWQAKPNMTNMEIIRMVKKASSHYENPDMMYGYGIPNFLKLLD